MVTAAFSSHNKAARFISLLAKNGIRGDLETRTSVGAGSGCSYGVRFERKDLAAAKQIAARAGLMPEKWL